MYFYQQACAKRSHAGIAFRPTQLSTHYPDKREIWHGVADCRSAPPCQISCLRGRNVRIQPPNLPNFRILAINLLLGDDSFIQFLRNSRLLYASVGGF